MATPAEEPASESIQIPDHELIRCVGKGSFGQVWLARNVIGTYRAIKIIRRNNFEEARPFEREFIGIQKFEPVSRTHPGLVDILQIGRQPQGDYYYYVMEVADDMDSGQAIQPDRYTPKTLSRINAATRRLPLEECFRLGLALADALGHLHKHGLVHRDIKPSNIIVVGGVPKLADIGLVTAIGDGTSVMGTLGFLPHEGAGHPSADLYSLGKVLYVTSMGKDVGSFPELPSNAEELTDVPAFFRWNEVLLRACDNNEQKRFQSAEEMQTALAPST